MPKGIRTTIDPRHVAYLEQAMPGVSLHKAIFHTIEMYRQSKEGTTSHAPTTLLQRVPNPQPEGLPGPGADWGIDWDCADDPDFRNLIFQDRHPLGLYEESVYEKTPCVAAQGA